MMPVYKFIKGNATGSFILVDAAQLVDVVVCITYKLASIYTWIVLFCLVNTDHISFHF